MSYIAKNTAVVFKFHVFSPQNISRIQPVPKKQPEENFKFVFSQVARGPKP